VILAAADPYLLYQIQAMVRAQGFRVVLAKTNLEIVLSAQQHHPALIVVDLDLASVELPDLLPMLRCYPVLAKVPVIAYSPLQNLSHWRTLIRDGLCQLAAAGLVVQKLIHLPGLIAYFHGLTSERAEGGHV
jgi:CheY-like chemotaxis protein